MIRTKNLITSSNKQEQELATLEKIAVDYKKGNYNNVFVLITNYLGHCEHYCSHSGLVYRLLDNLTFSIEKKEKGNTEKDNFLEFVNHLISDIKNF